jgi:hypothetical protein
VGDKEKDNDKKKNLKKLKKELNEENIKITQNTMDVNSDEERPGIGYEIFGKPPGNG